MYVYKDIIQKMAKYSSCRISIFCWHYLDILPAESKQAKNSSIGPKKIVLCGCAWHNSAPSWYDFCSCGDFFDENRHFKFMFDYIQFFKLRQGASMIRFVGRSVGQFGGLSVGPPVEKNWKSLNGQNFVVIISDSCSIMIWTNHDIMIWFGPIRGHSRNE